MLKEFTVPDVSCAHCVKAITEEVSTLQGVKRVHVDVNTKHVTVETDGQVSTEALVGAINEAGYDEVSVLN
jgi:copper chaperone